MVICKLDDNKKLIGIRMKAPLINGTTWRVSSLVFVLRLLLPCTWCSNDKADCVTNMQQNKNQQFLVIFLKTWLHWVQMCTKCNIGKLWSVVFFYFVTFEVLTPIQLWIESPPTSNFFDIVRLFSSGFQRINLMDNKRNGNEERNFNCVTNSSWDCCSRLWNISKYIKQYIFRT